jgi:hypothetical protein
MQSTLKLKKNFTHYFKGLKQDSIIESQKIKIQYVICNRSAIFGVLFSKTWSKNFRG